ncbi:MAG: carboxypeptidase regulatory-like domain-containing protein [Sphingobacteriales bacterium]|nr:carboxypeptidase regulatory-like domain-containing protein [Sphingobacteriales bacterium]
MGKPFQLTIPEPCHENWDKMSPAAQGRFCGSCQQQVVDFTTMSDRELLQFFKKPSTGSVCGRFMNDQLERDLLPPRRRIPWINYFFQIVWPAFLVSKVNGQRTQGKLMARPPADTSKVRIVPDNRMLGMVLPASIRPVCKDPEPVIKGDTIMTTTVTISGRIVNEKGEPVSYASVRDNFNSRWLVADTAGRFTLVTGSRGMQLELLVSAAGYEITKMMLNPEKYRRDELVIQLASKPPLQEVELTAAVGIRKGYVVGVTRNKKSEERAPVIPAAHAIHVYPNPVQTGQSLTISFEKMEEGYYAVQFKSLSGQTIKQEEIWIDAEARLMNLRVPAVAAGTYILYLVSKKTGQQSSATLILQ